MSVTDSLHSSEVPPQPNFLIEGQNSDIGFRFIAGVDEAGRGPLAGPVVAAAVILDPENIPAGLNDSKKLSAKKRESLFHEILTSSQVAWASICAKEIDRINIRQATLRAMERAVSRLPEVADLAMIDGRDVPEALKEIGKPYVKGDARSLSIAAASVIAKVIRDEMMVRSHEHFPEYGFAGHKGYGSKAHLVAIQNFGPCPIHRMSFSPLRDG